MYIYIYICVYIICIYAYMHIYMYIYKYINIHSAAALAARLGQKRVRSQELAAFFSDMGLSDPYAVEEVPTRNLKP